MRIFNKSIERQAGFSLIEIMVTVAIIGILAAIAVPSYTDYVTKGKIPDATANLATKRVQLEQSYLDNRTYVGATACAADSTTSQHFDFACVPTATTFTLTATGKGSMAGFSYTITEANVKSSTTSWGDSVNCWVTKKGGAC